MGLFGEKWPYTNFHDLNLDWLIGKLKEAWNQLQGKYGTDNPPPYPVKSVNGLTGDVTIPTNIETMVRKMICIGDSYAESPTLATSWATLCGEYLNASECHVVSKPGGGFQVNGNNKFLEGLQSVEVADPAGITDIVVAGGINDANTVSNYGDILTGITNFADYAKLTYPNAKIWIGFIGYTVFGSTYAPNVTGITYLNTINFYQKGCGLNGCAWLENASYVMQQYNYLSESDMLHPNNYGSQALAECIASCVRGGAPNWISDGDYMRISPITGEGNTINNHSAEYPEGLTYAANGMKFWQVPDFVFVFPSNITIGEHYTKIANIRPYTVFFNTPYEWQTTAQVIISSTFHDIPVSLKVTSDGLYIRSLQLDGGVFETITTNTIMTKSYTLVASMMM